LSAVQQHKKGPPPARNLRNVWSVASSPTPFAHFATMPPEIAERCIRAGSSERGCCGACGKPWVRVVESAPFTDRPNSDGVRRVVPPGVTPQRGSRYSETRATGWRPSCNCTPIGTQLAPSRILDPFAGSGTTGLVADRLGRDCTLIDLHTQYAEMAMNRIKDDVPLFAEVAAE